MLQDKKVRTWHDFSEAMEHGNTSGRIAGMVVYRKERRSQKGDRYAFVGFSDPTGQFELGVFSEVLQSSREILEPGNLVILTVSVTERDGEKKLTLLNVKSLKNGRDANMNSVRLFIDEGINLDSLMRRLPEPGSGKICLIIQTRDGRMETDVSRALKALPGVVHMESR